MLDEKIIARYNKSLLEGKCPIHWRLIVRGFLLRDKINMWLLGPFYSDLRLVTLQLQALLSEALPSGDFIYPQPTGC